MRRTPALLLAVTAGAVLAGAAPAPAAKLTVDAGSIGGRCRDARPAARVGPKRPWCTMARAAAAAPDGATVHVRRGTYPALVLRDVRRARKVTLKAWRGERPRVRGMELVGVSNLRLEGFRLRGLNRIERSSEVELSRNDVSVQGFIGGDSEDVTLVRNRIHDLGVDVRPAGEPGRRCHRFSPEAGVAPNCGHAFRINRGTRWRIRHNVLQRIPADGVQAAGTDQLVVEANRFEDVRPTIDPLEHSDGVQLIGRTTRTLIRGNLFVRSRGIISTPEAAGTFAGTSTELVIENNVFAGPGDFVATLVETPGVRVANNTAVPGAGALIMRDIPTLPDRLVDARVVNNILGRLEAVPAMFALEDYNMIGLGLRHGAHDIAGTPRLGDGWALLPGSPGTRAGLASESPPKDMLGRPRPREGRVDLGALHRP